MNVTLNNPKLLAEFEKLNKVTGYYVGGFQFGLRQAYDFSCDEISEVKKSSKRDVFVCVNKLMHENDLADLEQYLKQLNEIKVDYVVFSDFAVSELSEKINAEYQLIYGTETTITNHYFTELANEYGFCGVEVAKEITLKEIDEICKMKKAKVSIQIHGHMYMYQSVRKLLNNYENTVGRELNLSSELYLYDKERNCYYRIVENQQGTHILASNDLCMIQHLDKISSCDLDFIKVDGFGYLDEQYSKLISLYNDAFNDLELGTYNEKKAEYLPILKEICLHKKFDTGFYFKETVY